MISVSSVDSLDESSGVDMQKALSLFEMGFIVGRNRSDINNKSLHQLTITPAGAAMLAEWGALLERSSLKGRAMAIIERFVWSFVGMAFTVTGLVIAKVLGI